VTAPWEDPPQIPPHGPRAVDCGHITGDRCTHPCQTTRDLIELTWAPVWDLRDGA
jgi:hypothetical protein